jgi:hypothetical protein
MFNRIIRRALAGATNFGGALQTTISSCLLESERAGDPVLTTRNIILNSVLPCGTLVSEHFTLLADIAARSAVYISPNEPHVHLSLLPA